MYDYNCPDCNEAKLQSDKNARKINEVIDQVNQIIDNDIATTEYLLEKADEIVEEKANEVLGDLRTEIDNKANKDEIFSMANMGQDVKEAMTGGSVAVVGIDTILTENIIDKQVTPHKTSFLKPVMNGEINIVEKCTIKENGLYNPSTNEFISRDDIFTTEEFIEIYDLTYNYNTNAYTIYMFDKNKNHIGTTQQYAQNVVFEKNTKYIRPNYQYAKTNISDAFLKVPTFKFVFTNDIQINIPSNINNLNKKFIHISIDDTILIFKDLYENNYKSIFDNSLLLFLKNMHESYGACFSCYCFYQNDDNTFNLSMLSDKYKNEFMSCRSWLKFGFHGLDSNNYTDATWETAKNDYTTVMTNLFRITGSFESLDRVPRIQNYSGNINCVKEWIKNKNGGILGLLTADDGRHSYYMDDTQRDLINRHDRLFDYNTNITFFRTDMRLENTNNVTETLNTWINSCEYSTSINDLLFFTHEQLIDDTVKNKIIEVCEFGKANDYNFDFPMNKLI